MQLLSSVGILSVFLLYEGDHLTSDRNAPLSRRRRSSSDLDTTLIRIEIDENKCDCCGLCIDFCPVRVFAGDGGKPRVIKLNACYVCRTCEDLCPRKAVRVIET